MQVPMKVYQTSWQMTDCPKMNEPLYPHFFSLLHGTCMMLISGQHQTLCRGRTHCLSAARKAERDQVGESIACCGAILQVLQQGQHHALCMSLMAGEGLSGEGSLDTSVCHAIQFSAPGTTSSHASVLLQISCVS